MSTFLKRLFNVFEVIENGNKITIHGFKASYLYRDFTKWWETSKLVAWMFSDQKQNSLTFEKFFAPDFLYTLGEIKRYRHRWGTDRQYDMLREALLQHTWLRDTVREDLPSILNLDRLKEIGYALLPHQMEFLERYDWVVPRYHLKGYILSAAPGSGKTITCLALASVLESDLVVLIVPKNAVYEVWKKTLDNNMTDKPAYWIASEDKPYKGERYLIAHYEALPKVLEVVRRLKPHKPMVALDESHNLNEIGSLRTQLFVQLCSELNAQHVIWSSGTPLKAMGHEMLPILRTIDPYFTPEAENRFRQIYGRNANRALDILKNRVGLMSFKVPKEVIQKTKPIESEVKVKIPNAHDYTLSTIRNEMFEYIQVRLKFYKANRDLFQRIYDESLDIHAKTLTAAPQKKAFDLYRTYISVIKRGYDPKLHAVEAAYCNTYEKNNIIPSLPKELKEDFRNAKSVVKYVELKVMGEALGNVLGAKRSRCHVDMVPHMGLKDIVMGSAKKTVIFTSYVSVADAIVSHLMTEGLQPQVVYGSTNDNLQAILKKFETDPDCNPLVATYQSLSTAVPLVMANTAVFTNQPFRDYILTQAKSRVDRLGQDQQVYFVSTVLDTGTEPNLSTRSQDILEWSKEQVAAILGNENLALFSAGTDNLYGSTESYSEESLEDLFLDNDIW